MCLRTFPLSVTIRNHYTVTLLLNITRLTQLLFGI